MPPDRGAARRRRAADHRWLVTWTVLGGAFAVGINFTILAVSRPAIATDLGVSSSGLVWLISGPIVANALVTATVGKLGDLRGHRPVYMVGLAGTLVASIASALAPSATILVGARVLGAVVGAATGPASMAIINLMFAPEERQRPLGYWSLVAAGGPVVGLVVGGPIVDHLGWRWVFWIQIPLLLGALPLAWAVLPDTVRAVKVRFDVAGSVVLAGSVVAFLLGVERAGVWSRGPVIALMVGGLAGLGVFAFVERRVSDPLVPLEYFGKRSFVVPIVVMFFAQFGYMGGFILAPRLLAEVGGYSSSTISFLMVPRPLSFAIVGAMSATFVVRFGIRKVSVVSAGLVAVSLVAMALGSSGVNLVVICLSIAISGVGMGMLQPTVATSVANAVSNSDLGVAGATQQMVNQIATSLGMNLFDAVVGLVSGAGGAIVSSSALGGAFRTTYLIGAAITAVGAVAAWAMPSRRSFRAPP